jgi:hypothetical protein
MRGRPPRAPVCRRGVADDGQAGSFNVMCGRAMIGNVLGEAMFPTVPERVSQRRDMSRGEHIDTGGVETRGDCNERILP